MADEATPIETSATETVAANEAPAAPVEAETALGGAAAEGADAEEPAADAETGEAKDEAAKPEVPEAYELTFSEGIAADADTIAEATPILQELGLTNDQAQKFVPIIEAHTARQIEAYKASVDAFIGEQRAGWLNDAKADAEIGGSNWDSSVTDAAKALDRFGAVKGSEFRSLLDASGLGNHPEMIRMFARIGKATSEDSSFPRTDGNAVGARSLAETLYPPKS